MNIIMDQNRFKKSGILCKSCRRRIEYYGNPVVIKCNVCGAENFIWKNVEKAGRKY